MRAVRSWAALRRGPLGRRRGGCRRARRGRRTGCRAESGLRSTRLAAAPSRGRAPRSQVGLAAAVGAESGAEARAVGAGVAVERARHRGPRSWACGTGPGAWWPRPRSGPGPPAARQGPAEAPARVLARGRAPRAAEPPQEPGPAGSSGPERGRCDPRRTPAAPSRPWAEPPRRTTARWWSRAEALPRRPWPRPRGRAWPRRSGRAARRGATIRPLVTDVHLASTLRRASDAPRRGRAPCARAPSSRRAPRRSERGRAAPRRAAGGRRPDRAGTEGPAGTPEPPPGSGARR